MNGKFSYKKYLARHTLLEPGSGLSKPYASLLGTIKSINYLTRHSLSESWLPTQKDINWFFHLGKNALKFLALSIAVTPFYLLTYLFDLLQLATIRTYRAYQADATIKSWESKIELLDNETKQAIAHRHSICEKLVNSQHTDPEESIEELLKQLVECRKQHLVNYVEFENDLKDTIWEAYHLLLRYCQASTTDYPWTSTEFQQKYHAIIMKALILMDDYFVLSCEKLHIQKRRSNTQNVYKDGKEISLKELYQTINQCGGSEFYFTVSGGEFLPKFLVSAINFIEFSNPLYTFQVQYHGYDKETLDTYDKYDNCDTSVPKWIHYHNFFVEKGFIDYYNDAIKESHAPGIDNHGCLTQRYNCQTFGVMDRDESYDDDQTPHHAGVTQICHQKPPRRPRRYGLASINSTHITASRYYFWDTRYVNHENTFKDYTPQIRYGIEH